MEATSLAARLGAAIVDIEVRRDGTSVLGDTCSADLDRCLLVWEYAV